MVETAQPQDLRSLRDQISKDINELRVHYLNSIDVKFQKKDTSKPLSIGILGGGIAGLYTALLIDELNT